MTERASTPTRALTASSALCSQLTTIPGLKPKFSAADREQAQSRPVNRRSANSLILPTWLLVTLLSFRVSAATTNDIAATVGTNVCPQFTLQDQFEKTHRFTFPQTKPVVLTVADKKGSEGIKAWAHPLAEKFGDKIIIAGLADMSTVPGPLRGMVRSKFKKAVEYPVMLDWDGAPARSFNYTKGKANVYLVSWDGTILQHLTGEADEIQLKQLGEWIERELASIPQTKAHSN